MKVLMERSIWPNPTVGYILPWVAQRAIGNLIGVTFVHVFEECLVVHSVDVGDYDDFIGISHIDSWGCTSLGSTLAEL